MADDYIYAIDPAGKRHRAAKGTRVPDGWYEEGSTTGRRRMEQHNTTLLEDFEGWTQNEAKARQMAELKDAAKGDPHPVRAGARSLAPNILNSASKMYRGMVSSPKNWALTAAQMHPVTRAIAGAYMVGEGASSGGLKTPQALDQVRRIATGGQPTMSPEAAESALSSGAEMAGGAAAVKSGAPGTVNAAKGALGKTPEAHAAKSADLMDKVGSSDFNYGPKVDRAIKNGHLPEIERQYKPRTVRDAAVATKEYADNFEETHVKDSLKRHGNVKISGDDIAQAVSQSITPSVMKLAPEYAKAITREAQRYMGKDITLNEAFDYLKRMNAKTKALMKASPQSAKAAGVNSGVVEANFAASKALRGKLYGEMQNLGEPIGEFQKDYGALSTVAETLYKNTAKADRVGKGKSLTQTVLEGHNPWYALLSAGAAGYESGSPLVGAGAALAVPFAKWAFARRGTPNAVVSRAFEQAGKTGYQPPSPNQPTAQPYTFKGPSMPNPMQPAGSAMAAQASQLGPLAGTIPGRVFKPTAPEVQAYQQLGTTGLTIPNRLLRDPNKPVGPQEPESDIERDRR